MRHAAADRSREAGHIETTMDQPGGFAAGTLAPGGHGFQARTYPFMRQSPRNLGWMLPAARLHGGVTIRSLGRGAAMSDDPVRPAASTPEALHAIIADAVKA